FDDLKATEVDMLRIAKLAPEVRNVVVPLLPSGCTVDHAIQAAEATVKPPNSGTANGKPQPPKEYKFTDEEWLTCYTAKVRNQLQDKSAFDRDALFYRHTKDQRRALKVDIKTQLSCALDCRDSRSPQPTLAWMSRSVAFVNHPDHWFVCYE